VVVKAKEEKAEAVEEGAEKEENEEG
jgi:hypothetical protein